jgi:OOP family OmpA-OmpF porin
MINAMRAALVLLWTMTLPAIGADSNPVDELRSSLFETANQTLRKANEAQANILAPTSYGEAAEHYRDAEATLESGGAIESIRRDLDRASALFTKAAEHSATAVPTFQATLQAREDAVSSDARSYASGQWSKAEEAFGEAAVRLEQGRLRPAQRSGKKAEELYRDAELAAIKANYLNETRSLLSTAKDLRADRYAPHSYTMGSQLLNEAEQELNSNRYDTDRPRNLAQQAKHNALHAIYVARLERQIRDGDTSLEDILLKWEASLRGLANLVDTPIHFDTGEAQAIASIADKITTLQGENGRLGSELDDRAAQVAALSADVAALRTRLGGETEAVEQLNQLLEKQERQRQRFAQVEALFNESQAQVLRKGDSVIIRMIGLNFDVGQATLKPEHYALLSSLKSAIAEFPESSLVIEGHTDAFGSDALNLDLSQRRADAVQQYLLANAPVSPADLTALGYGESRPVANNETPEGRTRNRRIDVVIYPRW